MVLVCARSAIWVNTKLSKGKMNVCDVNQGYLLILPGHANADCALRGDMKIWLAVEVAKLVSLGHTKKNWPNKLAKPVLLEE